MCRSRCSPGQALVESALVLPLLITLALGVLQVVLYAHARGVLTSAAQEGARLAAEDGRGLNDGYARAEALVTAGLGSSVDPVRLDGRFEAEVVSVSVDAHMQPVTSRVFECSHRLHGTAREPDPVGDAPARGHGLKAAGLAAILLVPVAGAAEPPLGWVVATVTALAILIVVPMAGGRARWGWLTLVAAAAAIVIPRDQLEVVGSGLFVATGLGLVLWLVNGGSSQSKKGRPRPGSREREAQEQAGLSGERHVGQVLARELPQEYALINGLKLPRGAGDIDHVVVGPTGVFLLETKTMAGQIVCEADGTWRRTRIGRAGTPYAAYIGDPAAQVQRNIFAVRNCLRKRAAGLFRGTQLWVEGLVVFPHPRTELDVDHSRVPAMRLDQTAAYICLHVPQRGLDAHEVDQVVDALLVEGGERPQPVLDDTPSAQRAQALVEVVLVLPVVLALVFGTLAISRLIQAQNGVIAIAHEAARAGALGNSPEDAIDRMRRRVDLVAPGLGIDPRALELTWDVSTFTKDRGHVVASVRYAVNFGDLPLAGWVPPPAVRAEHVEWVDPYRGGLLVEHPTR
jgi:Flp pilus assembly protein TadG